MDQDSLNNAIANASALINNPQFNAIVEAKAGNAKKSAMNGTSAGSDLSLLEAQAFGGSQAAQQIQMPMIPKIKKQTSAQSNLPKEILESFKQQPALSGDDYSCMPPASYYGNQSTQQMIQEQTYAKAPQQTYQPQGGVIDYALIKSIVRECIAEQNKQLLNENRMAGIKMAGGNKIQFMDNKGNIYEGTLTLKKRVQN